MTYGTGDTSTDPYTSNVTEACIMLDTLQNSFISQGTYAVTLLKALKIYEVVYYDEDDHKLYDGSPYPVFLFTATTNVDDIKASASFITKRLPDAQFNVIAFNNTNLLQSMNFPASYVYSFFDLTYQNTDFHVCMRALMCGYLKKCDAMASTAIFTTPRVTPAMTTAAPATPPTTPPTTRVATTKPIKPITNAPTKKPTPASPTHGGGDGTHSTGYCQ
ncbi:unnamed protein product [Auanema sp. JU1783]|nr:unnamed protein product [Auanema sp. JU1783]